jgi:rare lipoprotein A
MRLVLLSLFPLLLQLPVSTQETRNLPQIIADSGEVVRVLPKFKPLYGVASYYADKFVGRETANGEHYSHIRMTAACNRLPLNTWIRVTNLRNKRTVVVKVNDRLHPKNPRVVDLSRMAAEKLGYIGYGLAQVKVEVLILKNAQ